MKLTGWLDHNRGQNKTNGYCCIKVTEKEEAEEKVMLYSYVFFRHLYSLSYYTYEQRVTNLTL